MSQRPGQSSRRDFLRRSAIGAAAIPVLLDPSRILGANDRLRIGIIGVGGRGGSNINGVKGEDIVALCDVDRGRLAKSKESHKGAATFTDYRELLEKSKLDAVVISTPDHHHAVAAARAISRGLHVYCEKPLTHTIHEARVLRRLANEKGVATQMGTQHHADEIYFRLVEYVRGGVLGAVKEIHVITDRPGNYWKQGLAKPKKTPEIPKNLEWDTWLGPAEDRAYHRDYVPFRWRGWWDFGCGAIGDMAIHLMDPAFWSLRLGGRPVRVTSEGSKLLTDSGPTHMKTIFDFPATTAGRAVKIFWYEGTAKPPEHIADDLPMNGSLFIGEKGRLSVKHASRKSLKLMLKPEFKDTKLPSKTLKRPSGHHSEWLDACRNGTPTGSSFGYAAPFTEIVLLGNVSFRSGQSIHYDPRRGVITNTDAANHLLTKSYRKGWELEG